MFSKKVIRKALDTGRIRQILESGILSLDEVQYIIDAVYEKLDKNTKACERCEKDYQHTIRILSERIHELEAKLQKVKDVFEDDRQNECESCEFNN